MTFEEKLVALFGTGRMEDAVYGIKAALASGISEKRIVHLIEKGNRTRARQIPPHPLILINGFQIGCGPSQWLVKDYEDDEWRYSPGYRFDLRTKKE